MSFVHPAFPGLLAVTLALYYLSGRSLRLQNLLLVAASLVFYGWVSPELVLLLLFSALLDYGAGIGVSRSKESGGTGTGWLVLSLVGNIGTLCGFKYFHFFEGPIVAALQKMGVPAHPLTTQVLLPLGLSFYTFQTFAYTIDVWRGQLAARRNLVDFLLFTCFFPQLVAGPVERASNLLAQVERPRTFDQERFFSGISLLLWGGFKKIVIADTMAPYVDLVYAQSEPSWSLIWAAALGFTIQVLADFSGYTDMARGTARLFGFELMENFRHPYLAQSPMEFWQRWHISFSTWLRDYVYLPASFSPWVRRHLTIPGTGEWSPFWHTARALTLTMLASGLWHGSTWNYVLWGLYYAVLGTVWAWVQQKIPRKVRKSRDWRPVLVPLFFCFTLLGMMIFREPDVGRLVQHLTANPFGGSPEQWELTWALLSICGLGAAPLLMGLLFESVLRQRLVSSPWRIPVRSVGWTLACLGILVFFRESAGDFVYFQF